MTDQNHHLLALSAQIVAAHAGHNAVGIKSLPDMIRNVYNTLAELGPPGRQAAAMAPRLDGEQYPDAHSHDGHNHHGHEHPKASDSYVHPTYGQTVFRDRLICMEDGLSMKMLKRHLLTVHGMTPDDYRKKWGLPETYPMVATEYAKLRSNLALQSGLGLKPEDRPAKTRRGRKGLK
jgi:predicted transcriptional regulator